MRCFLYLLIFREETAKETQSDVKSLVAHSKIKGPKKDSKSCHSQFHGFSYLKREFACYWNTG